MTTKMNRSLRDYAQHDEDCRSRGCSVCGWGHENGHHPECAAEGEQPRDCSCGLDAALLASDTPPPSPEQAYTWFSPTTRPPAGWCPLHVGPCHAPMSGWLIVAGLLVSIVCLVLVLR